MTLFRPKTSTLYVRVDQAGHLQATVDVVVDRIAEVLTLRNILKVVGFGCDIDELHRSIVSLDGLPRTTGSDTSSGVGVAANGKVGALWVWLEFTYERRKVGGAELNGLEVVSITEWVKVSL